MAPVSNVADKRVERSKAKVLEETYRQLTRGGIGGVSIDEISRSCGVSKTTIYRHWPTRSALLIDACSRLGGARPAPETGDLRSDLKALLSGLAEQLQTANWSSVYPSIIDAAERDPEIGAMQMALHKSFAAPFEAVLERAKDNGQLASKADTGDLVALLMGALFYRRWFSKETVTDEGFIDAIIARIASGG